jgi:ApaG protein
MSQVQDPELNLGAPVYKARSNGVEVAVWPELDITHSKAESAIYVYTYTLRIKSYREDTCQLMTRHWIITDGFNQLEHVVGDGVIGKQPMLRPGESFVYSSNCPLRTPTGSMKGTYQFVDSTQKVFEVLIPEFKLIHQSLVN